MEKSQQSHRWGILGLGKIARKMAADLALVPEAKLQAVASRSAKRAQDFAFEFGAERMYHDYHALCEDPEVDIVYIATPHSFHFEHASLAIEAGKAVLVEKPMGLNAHQAKALIEKARAHGVFLMEGIWTRFIPITEKYLELLKAEIIGPIKRLSADFGFRPAFNPDHRLFNPDLGGGSLLDIGIYPLYLSLLSLGKADTIKVSAKMGPSGVDIRCEVELNYPSGAEAHLLSSLEEETPTEARIIGEKGEIKLHRRFHHSELLSLDINQKVREIKLAYRGLGYVHEIEEVHRCLAAGHQESSKLPLSTSLELAELLDKVQAQFNNS